MRRAYAAMMRRTSSHAKRIPNPQRPLDEQTILHVLGKQRRAAGVQCGGGDHAVVDGQAMALREVHAQFMRDLGERMNLTNRTDGRQDVACFGVGHVQLARGNRGEFFEHLHAEVPPLANQRLRRIGLGIITRKKIEQDVGVEKMLRNAQALRAGRI